MPITDDDMEQIRRGDLRSPIVRLALTGFLHRHLETFGTSGKTIAEGLQLFVVTLDHPEVIERARALWEAGFRAP
jgi:hypothetical protein